MAMDAIEQAFTILDLERDAPPPKITQRYRDLALVWHPDRVGKGERLRRKAETKMKEINWAYAQLRGYHPELDSHLDAPQCTTEHKPPPEQSTSDASCRGPVRPRNQHNIPMLTPMFWGPYWGSNRAGG